MEWPVKTSVSSSDVTTKEELQLVKEIENLKNNSEKSCEEYEEECKLVAKESLRKVKKFQLNLLNFEQNRFDQISTLSNESMPKEGNLRCNFLNMAAEINIALSENLYVCNKELTSLQYQATGHETCNQ